MREARAGPAGGPPTSAPSRGRDRWSGLSCERASKPREVHGSSGFEATAADGLRTSTNELRQTLANVKPKPSSSSEKSDASAASLIDVASTSSEINASWVRSASAI